MKSNPGFQAYREYLRERCDRDDPRAVSALGDLVRYEHVLRDLDSYAVPSDQSLLTLTTIKFQDIQEGQVLLIRQRMPGRSRFDLQVVVAEKHLVHVKVLPIRVRIARSTDEEPYRSWEQYIYNDYGKHGQAVLRYDAKDVDEASSLRCIRDA